MPDGPERASPEQVQAFVGHSFVPFMFLLLDIASVRAGLDPAGSPRAARGRPRGELEATPPLGTGAASKLEFPDRVVNTGMGHAATRAVERAGFARVAEARAALKDMGKRLELEGLPPDALRDTRTNSFGIADRVLVPGIGNGGAALYQISLKARGEVVYALETVLVFRPASGPAAPGGWYTTK